MDDSYVQGFSDKCTSLGIEPDDLIKRAQVQPQQPAPASQPQQPSNLQRIGAPHPSALGVGQWAGRHLGRGIGKYMRSRQAAPQQPVPPVTGPLQ